MAKQDSDRFEWAGELAAAAAVAAGGARRREPVVSQGSGSASVAVPPRPSPSRRTLVGNALLAPFSLLVFSGTLIAGVFFASLPVVVSVSLLAYAAAVAVIYFDKDVRQKVLERQRAKGHTEQAVIIGTEGE